MKPSFPWLLLAIFLLCFFNSASAHYDPRVGRWIPRDPKGEEGGFNLYAYCGNDPVNRHDPLGLSDTWEWKWKKQPIWTTITSPIHALYDIVAIPVEGALSLADSAGNVGDHMHTAQALRESARDNRNSIKDLMQYDETRRTVLRNALPDVTNMAIGVPGQFWSGPVVFPLARAPIGGWLGATAREEIASVTGRGWALKATPSFGAKSSIPLALRDAETLTFGASSTGKHWPTIGEQPSLSVVRQLTDNSCGPACATTLLREEGREVWISNVALRSSMNRGVSGVWSEDLARGMNELIGASLDEPVWLGGMVDVARAIPVLESRGRPWIALLEPNASPGHFVIVDKISGGTVSIRDPRGLEFGMSVPDFVKLWANPQGDGSLVHRQLVKP